MDLRTLALLSQPPDNVVLADALSAAGDVSIPDIRLPPKPQRIAVFTPPRDIYRRQIRTEKASGQAAARRRKQMLKQGLVVEEPAPYVPPFDPFALPARQVVTGLASPDPAGSWDANGTPV